MRIGPAPTAYWLKLSQDEELLCDYLSTLCGQQHDSQAETCQRARRTLIGVKCPPPSIVGGTATSRACSTFFSPMETRNSISIQLTTRLSATVGMVTITAFAASHIALGDRKARRLCREPTVIGQPANRGARIRSWLDGNSMPRGRRRWRRPVL